MKKIVVALGLVLGFATLTAASNGDWLRAGNIYVKGLIYAGDNKVPITNASGNLASTSMALSTTLAVTGAATFASTVATTGVVTLSAIPVMSIGTLTAGTTQTQVGATAWNTKYFNVVTTGNANDGISLPAVVAGKCVAFRNTSANALKVYGLTPAKVNTVTTTTGAIFAASTGAQCCSDGTDWFCTGTST